MRQTPAAFRKSPMVAGSKGSPGKHKRVDSEQFIVPEENMNVSWLDGRGTWLAYGLVLAAVRLVLLFVPLFAVPLGLPEQWTLLNTLHCLLHYMAIHYNTGVPWTETRLMQVPDIYFIVLFVYPLLTRLMQGKYDPLTFWESLDIRYDHHKRFLIIMPILVYLVTINSDGYPPRISHLLLNTVMLSVALVPKYLQSAKNKIRRRQD